MRLVAAEQLEVPLEGLHEVAAVRREVELREEGDRARRLGLGEEAEEAEHGQPAVVDLGVAALGELLGRLLARAEAPVEVRERALEVGVLAREAAAHVVRVALARRLVGLELAPELEAAGHGVAAVLDLGLAQEADRRLVALLPEVLVA